MRTLRGAAHGNTSMWGSASAPIAHPSEASLAIRLKSEGCSFESGEGLCSTLWHLRARSACGRPTEPYELLHTRTLPGTLLTAGTRRLSPDRCGLTRRIVRFAASTGRSSAHRIEAQQDARSPSSKRVLVRAAIVAPTLSRSWQQTIPAFASPTSQRQPVPWAHSSNRPWPGSSPCSDKC